MLAKAGALKRRLHTGDRFQGKQMISLKCMISCLNSEEQDVK